MSVLDGSGPVTLVPDQALWAAAGIDLGAIEIEAVAGRARLMALAARLPAELGPALAETVLRFDDPGAIVVLADSPLEGISTAELLENVEKLATADPEHHDEGEHGHGGGHEDMMAVTGDPSADGLVMEDAEATVGPLSSALPTGLTAELTLDGDVVSRARIGTLGSDADSGAGDRLAPRCRLWARAAEAAVEPGQVPQLLAAVEIERVVSHSIWLARFAELIGWVDLGTRLRGAVRPLIRLNAVPVSDLGEASVPDCRELRETLRTAARSRRLLWRTRGLAPLTAGESEAAGIRGPSARASARAVDARSEHPAYVELGFDPVLADGGDTASRVRVRAEEAVAALDLARTALSLETLPAGGATIEGPRGPLGAGVDAWGSAAVRAAEDAAEGEELARALTAVASFDLSPGMVGR